MTAWIGRFAVLGAALSLACSNREGESHGDTGIATADDDGEDSGATGSTEGSGDDGKLDLPGNDSSSDDGECSSIDKQAEEVRLPADILFVIDNSGSMGDENGFVQEYMNSFAVQIELAEIDEHVVLISSYGNDGGICIDEPLGSGACPAADNNPPLFMHIDQSVSSSDSLQQIINHHADWAPSFREQSTKHIVVVSDDESDMDAATFDQMFKALDPSYAEYVFHAIVAFEAPDPIECQFGMAMCCLGFIPLADGVGEIYMDLVAQTGGVLGDLCDQEFQPVFNELSIAVVEKSPLACEFPIPEPPEGESFEPSEVNVRLELDGEATDIGWVEDASGCAAVTDGWYYDDPDAPVNIILCPQTCAKAQDADEAEIHIEFGCATVPAG